MLGASKWVLLASTSARMLCISPAAKARRVRSRQHLAQRDRAGGRDALDLLHQARQLGGSGAGGWRHRAATPQRRLRAHHPALAFASTGLRSRFHNGIWTVSLDGCGITACVVEKIAFAKHAKFRSAKAATRRRQFRRVPTSCEALRFPAVKPYGIPRDAPQFRQSRRCGRAVRAARATRARPAASPAAPKTGLRLLVFPLRRQQSLLPRRTGSGAGVPAA